MNIASSWKINYWLIISVILLISLFFALGLWQVKRAQWKQQLISQLQVRTQQQPINLNCTPPGAELALQELNFTPVVAVGQWLAEQYFLLDNQIVNKQPGFRVIMPFILAPCDANPNAAPSALLLVDRGFVPYNRHRADLPTIVTGTTPTTIRGIIYQPPSGYLLTADTHAQLASWPKIVQALDFTLLTEFLAKPAFHFILRLDADNGSALIQTPITFGVPVAKHWSYAVQWFSLSMLTAAYGVIIWWRRRPH